VPLIDRVLSLLLVEDHAEVRAALRVKFGIDDPIDEVSCQRFVGAEKLVGRRRWPKFFELTLQKVLFSTIGYGNCRAAGNRGKRTACFPPFPLRLENSANRAEFPTVSTASTAGHSL